MKSSLVFLLLVVLSVTLASDAKPSRLFKERIRTQDRETATSATEEHDSNDESDHEDLKKTDMVMGSMDTLASLARVQRDQAETFRLWSSQFKMFKNNVMKFMEQTSDVLQKNEKKIKTLQRVVRKIASDIDE